MLDRMSTWTRIVKRSKLGIAVAAFAVALVLVSCRGPVGPQGQVGPQGPPGSAGGSAAATAATDSQTGYDFTLLAEGGSARLIEKGLYEITLTGVHPQVLAFQDRPNRGFGHFEYESLVHLWPQMYSDGNGPPMPPWSAETWKAGPSTLSQWRWRLQVLVTPAGP